MLPGLLLCRHLLRRQYSCLKPPAHIRLQASLAALSNPSSTTSATWALAFQRSLSTAVHTQSAAASPTDTSKKRTAKAQAKKDYHDKIREDTRKGTQKDRKQPQARQANTSPDKSEPAQQVPRDSPQTLRTRQSARPKLLHGSLSSPADVNKLVELQQDLLGEAFEKPEAGFRTLLLRGGCKGLQDELAATKSGSILYRQCYQELFDLADAARARQSGQSQDHQIQHSPAQGPPVATEEGLQSDDTAASSPTGGSSTPSTGSTSGNEFLSSTGRVPQAAVSSESSAQPAYKTPAGRVQKLYITGGAGSGKSVALAAFVHWARSQGWMALYLPSAWQLTGGGFFPQHSEGHWDTPECAQLLLQGLVAHHGQQLQELRSRDGNSTLAELAARGLQDVQGGDVATQMALEVKEALFAQTEVPVLVAIDSYEALYSPSEYGEWLTQHKRRQLDPSELRLANSLRILEGPAPKRGFVACIDTGSRNKHAPPIPRGPKTITRSFEVPRFTQEEYKLIIAHYSEQRLLHAAWRPEQQQLAYYATGGNGKEARRYRDAIIQPGMF